MIYDIAFFIFSLFYLPSLLFKGKLGDGFIERFAVYDEAKSKALSSGKAKIWIEAVSVGEVAACKSLIPLLLERFAGHEIVLSTVTRTGNDLAKSIFPQGVTVIYFPLDFSFIVKRALDIIRPRIYVMVETEIWPNFLIETARRHIPAVLINGRISDRSFGKYRVAKPFLKNTLKSITLFSMQSAAHADRIKQLGAPEDRVKISGNMKLDADVAVDERFVKNMRESLGLEADGSLFVAGSTHEGEERIVLSAYKELHKEFPDLKLLIAPRHIDRVNAIERLVQSANLEAVRVSSLPVTGHKSPACRLQKPGQAQLTSVFLLDTIGQLKNFYAIATLVFIGGSLIRHGGQNPIEPAMFEKPIIFGPHMFNFRDIANLLLENDAAVQILSGEELPVKASSLLRDDVTRMTLGRNAKRTILENRGATASNLDAIINLTG